jgi:hypothetical protein
MGGFHRPSMFWDRFSILSRRFRIHMFSEKRDG